MRAADIEPAWRETLIRANGIDLHVVEAGPPDGEAVVMLHGFPEFWYAWKHYLRSLSAAGYRVIVPDQRGYNLSAKPRGAAPYNVETLAADVVGLIDAVAVRRAVLVGHDWGGYLAWWTAARHASRIERLVILNIPHPRAFLRQMIRDVRQVGRSWYIFLLQLPWLPEWLMTHNSFATLLGMLSWDGDHGPISDDDRAAYVEAWSQGHAMTAMINWYRAAFRTFPRTLDDPRIRVPTMLIWGERDPFLDRSLAEASIKYCDSGRVVYVPDATHWVHHERPERVAGLILGFLREATAGRDRAAGT